MIYCKLVEGQLIFAPQEIFIEDSIVHNPTEEQLQKTRDLGIASLAFDMTRKKSVWFMISESYGKYSITMYYDNEYNHANGEDL